MFEEIASPLLYSERGRQVGLAALILTLILVFYTAASTFYNWYADISLTREKPQTTQITSNGNAEAQLIAAIPEQHLFGKDLSDEDFLPITSLQLHLTGILTGGTKGHGRVIISQGGQAGKIYDLGDLIASGIRISAINDDGIVLEHGGKLEKLPLGREPLQFQGPPKTMWETG